MLWTKYKYKILTQIVLTSNVSHDSIALHYLSVSILQVGQLWWDVKMSIIIYILYFQLYTFINGLNWLTLGKSIPSLGFSSVQQLLSKSGAVWEKYRWDDEASILDTCNISLGIKLCICWNLYFTFTTNVKLVLILGAGVFQKQTSRLCELD